MWLAGALNKKGVGASHTFIDNGLHFTVTETGKCGIAEWVVVMFGNLCRKFGGCGTGEQFYFWHRKVV